MAYWRIRCICKQDLWTIWYRKSKICISRHKLKINITDTILILIYQIQAFPTSYYMDFQEKEAKLIFAIVVLFMKIDRNCIKAWSLLKSIQSISLENSWKSQKSSKKGEFCRKTVSKFSSPCPNCRFPSLPKRAGGHRVKPPEYFQSWKTIYPPTLSEQCLCQYVNST